MAEVIPTGLQTQNSTRVAETRTRPYPYRLFRKPSPRRKIKSNLPYPRPVPARRRLTSLSHTLLRSHTYWKLGSGRDPGTGAVGVGAEDTDVGSSPDRRNLPEVRNDKGVATRKSALAER